MGSYAYVLRGGRRNVLSRRLMVIVRVIWRCREQEGGVTILVSLKVLASGARV